MVVSTSGSSTDVGNFFNQAENADLTADLSTILAGKMKSGNYYMALNYCGGTVINFNFGTTYPVTLSNSEFTVQYAYSEQ